MEFNLPKIGSFLFCNNIQQDVFNKNYELRGVFQGFSPPGYPLGAEFMTFTRFYFEGTGEFQIELSLFNEKGEKISDSMPRKLVFGEIPIHDLITGWRVIFPASGRYVFKVFCNNLNLGEFLVFCK
jgi:hypothetical protein